MSRRPPVRAFAVAILAVLVVATAGAPVAARARVTAGLGGPVITTVAGGLATGPAVNFTHTLRNVLVSGTTAYASDETFNVVRAIDLTTGQERVVAGVGSNEGFYGDGGPALAAGLSAPRGLAIDGAGNLFVADAGNSRIRRVAPDGIITTVAGGGTNGASGEGGPATAATIQPDHIVLDAHGNLLFTDGNLVRKLDRAGIVTTVAGGGSGALADGQQARAGTLNMPAGLSFDPAGNLFLAEYIGRRVWRIAPDGTVARVLRRLPDGTASGDWDYPVDVHVRPDGSLLVLTKRQVMVVDGAQPTSVLVGDGTYGWNGDGGPATAAQLADPTDLDLDDSGNLYIANSKLRRVGTDGVITNLVGYGSAQAWDGHPAVDIEMSRPGSVAAAADGTWYVGESAMGRIHRIDASGVKTTVSGDSGVAPADGLTALGTYASPRVLTTGPGGQLYVAINQGQVYRVNGGGVLHLVAGKAGVPCKYWVDCAAGDNGPATAAQLPMTNGLAVTADGTVYITDEQNNRVRRVNPSTGIITTVVGGPQRWFSGDGEAASTAMVSGPASVQTDAWGNIFFVDTGNYRVRKIDRSGVITTVAGSGVAGYGGDGGRAVDASMTPSRMALDPHGNLFVTDGPRIRKVDLDGVITTVAGSGGKGFRGDGGPALDATFTNPSALAVDVNGNLLVVDSDNNRVRRVAGVAAGRPPGPARGWGWNVLGQAPAVGAMSGFTKVAAGGYHSVGLRGDGTVWAWGYNVLGQLGNGTTSGAGPVRVGGTSLNGVTQVAAGAFHSLALRSDGTVWAWGWNHFGQLGDATTVTRTGPVRVTGLEDVVAVAAGTGHSLALTADGTVWSWGWNGVGQLGNTSSFDTPFPIQVPGLTGVAAIAAGAYHSVVATEAGGVASWGWNYYGQLGDGTTIDRRQPVAVPGPAGVTQVAAGVFHTLALGGDGGLWGWGWNGVGQLGTGSATDTRRPVVAALGIGRPLTEIAAGSYHSLAVDSTGQTWTWGWNAYGQMGDGTTTNRPVPFALPGATATSTVSGGVAHSVRSGS